MLNSLPVKGIVPMPSDPTEPGNQRAMIENALCQYAWAFDMDEMSLMGACFTSECKVHFQDCLRIGREAVVEELTQRRAKYPEQETPWHLVSNVFTRPQTSGEVFVASWFSFGAMKAGKEPALASFGWYDDIFVLEDSQWRIAHRRVLRPYQR
jgi:hypothetical protein